MHVSSQKNNPNPFLPLTKQEGQNQLREEVSTLERGKHENLYINCLHKYTLTA